MRRVEDDADQMIGQDSFLDVVTNIVGILILLVMVVGMRTSQAVETAAGNEATSSSAEKPINKEQISAAFDTAADTERSVHDLVHRVVRTHQETLLREQERVWLNTAVAEAEQEIADRRAGLNLQDQRDFDLRRKLAEAQTALDELTREQIALLSEAPAVEEIECEPTPLGKIVSGKEVHLLLAEDHVAVIPFEELLERMKEDVTGNIWRLKDQNELERTVGPIEGFRLRYWFVKTEVVARSDAGAVVSGQFPQFSHCFFLPVTTPAGEPAAEALQPNSELRQYVRRLNPHGTTVTIWTYPGNYDRLREIKRGIRELGFQIAVRPLPKGMPIGASRSGSESVTE